MPAGLVIATDQATARAYAHDPHRTHRARRRPSCSATRPRLERAHPAVRRGRRSAGWWRCAWCRRASTCRGCRSGVYATSAVDAAVLRPGDRTFRARPAARRAGVDLRAERADPAGAGVRAGARARPRARPRDGGRRSCSTTRLLERAEPAEAASADLLDEYEWTALGSVATFEKVLYDGEEFGSLAEPGSAEEWDFIGLPGILEPDQVSELLKAGSSARRGTPATSGRERRLTAEHRRAAAAAPHAGRAAQAAQQPGVDPRARHGSDRTRMVHAEVRRACGGPEVAKATVAQLQSRIDWLRGRLGPADADGHGYAMSHARQRRHAVRHPSSRFRPRTTR